MPIQKLQQIAAAVLLVLSTAPICLLLADLLADFEGSIVTKVIGAPSSAALYTTYLALIFSTLLGADTLNSLKTKQGDKDVVTREGLFVFGYTGIIAIVGLLFLALLSHSESFNDLQAATTAQGAAQVQSYASWVVGVSLGAVSTLLGIRAS